MVGSNKASTGSGAMNLYSSNNNKSEGENKFEELDRCTVKEGE